MTERIDVPGSAQHTSGGGAQLGLALLSGIGFWLPVVLIGWGALDAIHAALIILVAGLSILAGVQTDWLSLRLPRGADAFSTQLSAVSLLTAIIAPLDFRYWHLSDSVPGWLRWTALALAVIGYGLRWAAVRVNPFFAGLIATQPERGHTAISSGPYALVRHPAYLGVLLGVLFEPLALNSWLSLLPGLVAAVAVVMRTVREDAALRGSLPGYADYTERVRARLVPGLW